MSDWIGKVMRDNKGRIGKVIGDSNGVFRILEIRFETPDEQGLFEYSLWLANMGDDPMDKLGIMWKIDTGDLKDTFMYLSDYHVHPDGTECKGAGKICERDNK